MITPDLLSLATGMAPVPVKMRVCFSYPETQKQGLILEGTERITLRHHKGAFVGCFSLRLKKQINWELFKTWKTTRNPSLTEAMARDFLPFIKNHYDLITTAPPSASRGPTRYCVYDLAKAISRITHVPFSSAFSQKTEKRYHGRHESLKQSKPEILASWSIRNKSLLFVDDCITSGTTARLCYEALVSFGNHVDGLIWVSAG